MRPAINPELLCRCGHLGAAHGVDSDPRDPDEVCSEPGCACERFRSFEEAAEPETPPNVVPLHAIVEGNWAAFLEELVKQPDALCGAVLVLPARKVVYCIAMSQNDVIAELTRALHEILDGGTKGPWSM